MRIAWRDLGHFDDRHQGPDAFARRRRRPGKNSAWRKPATTTVARYGVISARFGPKTHRHALVLNGVGRLRHILKIDRPNSLRRTVDDEIVVILGGRQLSLGLKQQGLVGAVKLPRADVAGSRLDRCRQIVERDIANCQFRRIGLDEHRGFSAVDHHAAHAFENADALANLRVGKVIHRALGRRIARQRDVHDRLIVGIGLGERGRGRKIDGQLALCLADGGSAHPWPRHQDLLLSSARIVQNKARHALAAFGASSPGFPARESA